MTGVRKVLFAVSAAALAGVLSVASPVQALTLTEIRQEAAVYLSSQYEAGTLQPSSFAMGEADWAAIALVAEGSIDPATIFDGNSVSLSGYVANEDTTAHGRKVLALQALGVDSSAAQQQLLASVIGGQFGDSSLLNDDYFGIIAAYASGNSALASKVQSAVDFILKSQKTDGGFAYSTTYGADSNSTAAAIIALAAAGELGVDTQATQDALSAAIGYLLTAQASDGGFEYDTSSGWGSDADSTAWAIMALGMFGDEFAPEISSARTWLLTMRNADGGFRSWAASSNNYTTAQTLIALNGTTWLLDITPSLAITVVTPEETPAPQPVTPAVSAVSPTPAPMPTATKKAAVVPVSQAYVPTAAAYVAPEPIEVPTKTQAVETTTTPDKSQITTTEPTSWRKTLGLSLAACGLAIFAVYIFGRRRKISA